MRDYSGAQVPKRGLGTVVLRLRNGLNQEPVHRIELYLRQNVICVIQTDGHENASEEYTAAELAKLIRRKEREGWAFVFLAAGLDAFSAAREFGIKLEMALSYGREESHAAFDAISRNTRAYRKTGKVADMAFSEDQRVRAGDRYFERHTQNAPERDGATVVEDISLDS